MTFKLNVFHCLSVSIEAGSAFFLKIARGFKKNRKFSLVKFIAEKLMYSEILKGLEITVMKDTS